jgi:hypothetical protein
MVISIVIPDCLVNSPVLGRASANDAQRQPRRATALYQPGDLMPVDA